MSGRKEARIPADFAPIIMHQLGDFLREHQNGSEKYTIVGKNFDAFDARFLERIPGWDTYVKPLCERRTLDVGSLCFRPGDGRVESLEKCLEMVGIRDTTTHRALDDALQVATVVSRFFA